MTDLNRLRLPTRDITLDFSNAQPIPPERTANIHDGTMSQLNLADLGSDSMFAGTTMVALTCPNSSVVGEDTPSLAARGGLSSVFLIPLHQNTTVNCEIITTSNRNDSGAPTG